MTVHVVGNIGIDRSFRLPRLPRAGETLNAASTVEGIGGKGANQAVAAARAVAAVRLYAAVGTDAAGDRLAADMAGEGVEPVFVRLALPTDHSAILVDAAGENLIATAAACAQAFDPLGETDLAARLAPGDVLLMQGNLRPDVTDACLAAATAAGARTVFNPSPLGTERVALAGLSLVIANAGEARALTGASDPETAVAALVADGPLTAIVTMGAAGALVADGHGVTLHPAPPVDAVDTAGAGDCFAGTLVGLMAAGLALGSAVDVATAAAAIAVTRHGTLAAFPSRDEVAALVRAHPRHEVSDMTPAIGPQGQDTLRTLFGRDQPIIGVVHLLPLPGAPRFDGEAVEAIYQRGLDDARAYLAGGCDAVIVENHGDIPFSKPDDIGPETAAHMAVVSDRIRRELKRPIGINVLANAAIPALAIASAAGASFVRVNQWANAYVANEGFVEGEAARAMRYRNHLRAKGIRIFADAHVKHGAHAIVADRPVEEQVKDLVFFDADVVIATGQRTGHAADVGYIAMIREAAGLPTLVGSGVTPDNVLDILAVADGVIVASSLKHEGVWWNAVDPDRVRRFIGRLGR